MFKELADLGRKRSRKEAVGFYLAYLALILIGAMLTGVTLALLVSTEDFNGFAIGAVFAAFSCAVLSYLILQEKGQMKEFSSYVLILAAMGVSLLVGGIFGMIIVAYLTTKEKAASV